MAAVFLFLVITVTIFGRSDAAWCVCRSDASNTALQKALDYACGGGADCTPIQQNGACYNPNTVLAHCSYAANSYYQRKGQAQGACDFASTAIVTSTDPGGNGCTYPATPRYFLLNLCYRNIKHSYKHKHHHPKLHNSYHLHPKHRHHREYCKCAGRTWTLRHYQQHRWQRWGHASKGRSGLSPFTSLAVTLDSTEGMSPHLDLTGFRFLRK
ncbi:hypothetical protein C4D60_Mb05t08980 [Musa balbisiana]|uniref:X8 domain-containing protein n=1 Tax=Musa balbisiana TaxID=52838 RepID=A0A4V4H812_MUSBA|nr:hypothetical protein C4D60_Mb05t08980 [Musa balbisiana]